MRKSAHTAQYRYFQELLLAARRTAELTQADVAKRLKRPQSFVAKYENGERRLDIIELAEIAAILDVDPVAIIQQVLAHGRRRSKADAEH